MSLPAFRVFATISLACFPIGSGLAQVAPTERLLAQDKTVDVREGGELTVGRWSLDVSQQPDILTAALAQGERREVCFISGPNRLCRTVGVGDKFDFVITHAGVDYPTRIEGRFVPPAAKFDAAYQAAHRGKVTVLVPEVYELVNVAIALTPLARENQFLVMRDSDYHRELQTHFAPVANHPLVQWLEAEMRKSTTNYFTHKMNGYAFDYGAENQIVRSAIYDRTGFRGQTDNSLLPMLSVLQDFSDKSNFRTFFARHRSFYQGQIDFIEREMNIDAMFTWLKREFPKVKPYDHIKVVFSPLVFGSQSVTWIENAGFSELQPHVNFPYAQNFTLPVSERARTIQRGNLLFTEINHGFINPTAEENYGAQIAAALSNRATWARPDSPSDSYPSPMALFNEYMNWGLVSLYYTDVAPPADLNALVAQNEKNMLERRGFTRFPEFSQFLVKTYRERPAGATIADLYPRIIAWFAERNAAATPSAGR